MVEQLRIDKWLWAVRIYKTRSLASEACKKNKILINDEIAKPSKLIKKSDTIQVSKKQVTYIYKVIDLTHKRISAKLIPDYLINLTSQEELNKLKPAKFPDFAKRERGSGRPTKKERRTIDRLQNNS